jgi:prevent-host-death family protein
MNIASIGEIASHFDAYVKASESGPVVVTRKGKPVAVLFPTKNEDDLERLLLGHSRKLQTILAAARKRFREGGGIPHEEFWKEVEADNPATAKKQGRAAKKNRLRPKAAKAHGTPN